MNGFINIDFGVVLGRLGAILGRLGAILGRLGAILGPSWGVLGRSWGGLGAILGPSWGFLGRLGAAGPFSAMWASFFRKKVPVYCFFTVIGARGGSSEPDPLISTGSTGSTGNATSGPEPTLGSPRRGPGLR